MCGLGMQLFVCLPLSSQAFQTAKMFLQELEKLSQDPEAAAEQQKTEGELLVGPCDL